MIMSGNALLRDATTDSLDLVLDLQAHPGNRTGMTFEDRCVLQGCQNVLEEQQSSERCWGLKISMVLCF